MAIVGDAWRWLVRKVQPVTALTTVLMILAYLDCTKFDRLLQPQTSLGWRALLCVFYHKSGLHLFIDLLWALNMGSQFEKLHGSWHFLVTMTLMIFLSQGFTLLVNLPHVFFKKQRPHISMLCPQLNNYTLGFSGVLFALHFLLVTSSQHHSMGYGPHSLSRNHGLLIKGLFLLASLQTLILSDSHFFNNLSGIAAGFVYLNIPPMLKIIMVCVKVVYTNMLRPMFHTMYKAFHNLGIELEEYNHNDQYYPRDSRSYNRSYIDTDHYGLEQEVVEEEDGEDEDLDVTLQWECKTCLRRNGAFLSFCEFCTHTRTLA